MKTHNLRSIVLASILALALSGFAQAAVQLYIISNTTLNGAISETQTTLVLTSASASSGSSFGAPAAGQCLFVDRELMRIVSMASTTATVQRNVVSGRSPHATGAVVFTAPCAMFKTTDPIPSGNVDCTLQPGPWINTNNGNTWFCSVNRWIGANAAPITYNSVLTVS